MTQLKVGYLVSYSNTMRLPAYEFKENGLEKVLSPFYRRETEAQIVTCPSLQRKSLAKIGIEFRSPES